MLRRHQFRVFVLYGFERVWPVYSQTSWNVTNEIPYLSLQIAFSLSFSLQICMIIQVILQTFPQKLNTASLWQIQWHPKKRCKTVWNSFYLKFGFHCMAIFLWRKQILLCNIIMFRINDYTVSLFSIPSPFWVVHSNSFLHRNQALNRFFQILSATITYHASTE